MGHHHGCHHHHHHDSTSNIKIAFLLNLGFTILEIIGGLWTNSLAILSDALHDLGDSLSLGLAWRLDKLSKKEYDEKYSYGYKRFSLLAALINTIVLLIGSIFILSEAIPRILNPEPVNQYGMLFFALGGILVNGIAVLRLRGGKSMNAQVVSLHLLEDVLGWVAVLVVSIVLIFKEIHILDPILSILITLYVLYNAVNNLRRTISVFLQAVPDDIDVLDVEEKLLNIDKVMDTHHTHIWSLDGEHNVLTTHIVVGEETTKNDVLVVKNKIKSLIGGFNCEHVTIEIEYANNGDCSMDKVYNA